MSLIKKVWTLLIRQKKTGWRTEVPKPILKNISEFANTEILGYIQIILSTEVY